MVNNTSINPVVWAAHPATGNGRLTVQAFPDRLRLEAKNAANTAFRRIDLSSIHIQDGVPFVLSVAVEDDLLWVDYGTGGTTTGMLTD